MNHTRRKPLQLRYFINFLLLITPLLFSSAYAQDTLTAGEVSHTFYITANTGLSRGNSHSILSAIATASRQDETSTLLLPGNITPKKGFPADPVARQRTREYLRKNLLQPLGGFNGNIVFIPGVHEWNRWAPASIDDLESFLQEHSRAEFEPDDGCPLEEESINEQVVLITIDSQWYLEDWDDHPEMNTDCEIKTREQLFTEFKDALKDNHGRTKIVAIHHPMMSNNRFGFLERIGGFRTQSFHNQKQSQLRGRLETLASLYEDVIFVSGNHRNLQYLHNDRNPQIISGAASGTEAAKAKDDEHFASVQPGYAKLVVYKDLSSRVEFFEVTQQETKAVFRRKIERELIRPEEITAIPTEEVASTRSAAIYSPEETDKSEFHQWVWGETYREVYSKRIEAPVLYIDTLPGNLRPLKVGGGQQSRSLRFINDRGYEYTLRALRKSPLRYVQADLVKESFIGDFLEDTAIERYLADFYTTAHPYAPFAINGLSEALEIRHVKPEIFYVPKQERLGIHNREYGDELFMLEPHIGDENRHLESFGSPDDILSTMDLLMEIRENKDSRVDEASYIRARLFDMLIGDWDRHEDQWRWAESQQENGGKVYYPIPRDRDQAFSRYDGALIALVKLSVPVLRKMQSYQNDIKNLKWFNWSGYPLDERLINTAGWEDWEKQVNFLQQNLTDEVIEQAFAALPSEVQDESIEEIKAVLKVRRERLMETAREYHEHFLKFRTITGTEGPDVFRITRKPAGITEVSITTEGEEHFSHSYDDANTREIWIYGLNGEDRFILEGKGNDLVRLRVLGGAGHDTYDFDNVRKAKIYDHKSRESTIINPRSSKWLVDSYDINAYDHTRRRYHENRVLPFADFVPDAGLAVGVRNIYTTYGLVRNPFTTQHRLGANFYFATTGYELNYSGEFAHVFHNWNLGLEGRYTSPNYFLNYFGTGNETQYDPGAVERDFNRVKIQQWQIAAPLIWRNETGSSLFIRPMLESMEVHPEEDDFVSRVFSPGDAVFDDQLYAGAEASFNYYNKNNASYPSRGMELDLTTGYRTNLDGNGNRFGYLEPSFSFNYPLIPSGFAVFATKIGGEAIIGENYEFYHAATLGGNENLRGYRNHRFNGQRSFYQSTDLRTAFALVETNFIPIILGVSAGFDYGRVWAPNEDSGRWHHNYGGSFWINALYAVTGNIGFYRGGDGNRLTFTMNFKY